MPSKSKKIALQTDLQQKRELIRQLNQRISELNQLDFSDSDSDEEDEGSLPSYAPRIQADAGRDVTTTGGEGNEALLNAAENFTSSVRRRGKGGVEAGAQTASGNSLFAGKSPSTTTTTGDPNLAQTDAVLSHNRTEQDSLTDSLVEMAKQLRQEAVNFGQTLESDKNVLNRALSGLDQNQLGMDAASQRMGTLRRMTEGRGFFDRLKLYALIFGLWIVAFMIVFVGPKIRF